MSEYGRGIIMKFFTEMIMEDSYVMVPRLFVMNEKYLNRGMETETMKEYNFQMEEADLTKVNSGLFSIAFRLYNHVKVAKNKAIEWQLDNDIQENANIDELFKSFEYIKELSDVRIVALTDSDLRLSCKRGTPKIWYGKDFQSEYGHIFTEQRTNVRISPLYPIREKLVYLYYHNEKNQIFLFRSSSPARIRSGTRFCHTCFSVFSGALTCFCESRVKLNRVIKVANCQSCGEQYLSNGTCQCKKFMRRLRYKIYGV